MDGHARCLAAAVIVAALIVPGASAQQSSGNITGDGKAGDVVHVARAATGYARDVTLDQDGKYRIPRVAAGTYVVTVTHADGTVDKPKTVTVQLGTTTRVK